MLSDMLAEVDAGIKIGLHRVQSPYYNLNQIQGDQIQLNKVLLDLQDPSCIIRMQT